MKRFLCVTIALLVVLATNLCCAAVFERDWKTPGDGLLTYDDVNQREWLDLSVSAVGQFAEPRRENAIAEIAPGGLFEGFTFAKRDDVIALAQSAEIDTSTTDFSVNEGPTRSLIDLLSPTPPWTGPILDSIGFIDEVLPPPYRADRVAADFYVHPRGDSGFAALFVGADIDGLGRDTVGLMLYRAVPEPSSLFLAVLSAGLWIFLGRCQSMNSQALQSCAARWIPC